MFAAELPPEHDDPLGPLMEQLRQRQWGVLDGWLPDPVLRALRADLLRLRLAARFRPTLGWRFSLHEPGGRRVQPYLKSTSPGTG